MIDLSDLGIPRPWVFVFHMSWRAKRLRRLRICSDICLFLYTSELPLLFLVRGKRLLKDWMVILDIEPQPNRTLSSCAHSTISKKQLHRGSRCSSEREVWKFNIFSCVFEVPKVTRLWVTAFYVAVLTLGSDHPAVLELGDHPLWVRGDLCEPNWFQPWHEWSRLGRSHCQNQRAACAPTCAHLVSV
jgi:hypothetical protein